MRVPRGAIGIYEEMGPCGQSPGFDFAGGAGAHRAATASSGSRLRMRGDS